MYIIQSKGENNQRKYSSYCEDRENKIRKYKFKENIKQMTSVRPSILVSIINVMGTNSSTKKSLHWVKIFFNYIYIYIIHRHAHTHTHEKVWVSNANSGELRDGGKYNYKKFKGEVNTLL